MCLAVPGRIIEISENKESVRMAKADFAGVISNVCIDWLPDVRIGDYVLVHVGFALNKIDEKEAEETLEALREMSRAIESRVGSNVRR
jgi:hydrogenase expression/formation protein HypC